MNGNFVDLSGAVVPKFGLDNYVFSKGVLLISHFHPSIQNSGRAQAAGQIIHLSVMNY